MNQISFCFYKKKYFQDEQTDLREQVKRINEQNAQILARMNRSKEFSVRFDELEDVDKFEGKIDTNQKKKNLVGYKTFNLFCCMSKIWF